MSVRNGMPTRGGTARGHSGKKTEKNEFAHTHSSFLLESTNELRISVGEHIILYILLFVRLVISTRD